MLLLTTKGTSKTAKEGSPTATLRSKGVPSLMTMPEEEDGCDGMGEEFAATKASFK
jgi:hypothetical protein